MNYLFKQYLKYCINSTRIGSSDNEFLKSFKTEVLNKSINTNDLQKIDKLRKYHLRHNKQILAEDYGAGSKTSKQEKILNTSNLAKNVSVKKKYGKVLNNLVRFLKIENTLELGTSLGISSAYLSNSKLISIEGNTELAKYTAEKLKEFKFNNIEVVNAQFDDVLEKLIKENTYDLIFIDGNHSKEATLRYFELIIKQKKNKPVIIFDDINWSFGMNNAWNIIKAHKEVNLSIDLFTFGIVFFNKKTAKKENVVVWY